jgi:hypothetical protein
MYQLNNQFFRLFDESVSAFQEPCITADAFVIPDIISDPLYKITIAMRINSVDDL